MASINMHQYGTKMTYTEGREERSYGEYKCVKNVFRF